MEAQLRIFSRPRRVTAETTQRTLQCRSLLRPDPVFNDRVVGVLAKAQECYDVEIHAFTVMTDHLHILATFEDVEQMARFHCHFVTHLSKEVGWVHDWPGTVFPDPYHHVELSEEPEIEAARLRYVLGQGCKENLVSSPLDWPGASSTEALMAGGSVEGEWIDRTSLCRARDRGEEVSDSDFAQKMEVDLTPIPSLAHLSPEDYRLFVVGLVREIEKETAARHKLEGTCPLGIAAILARHPHERPNEVKSSPCPWFHALKPEYREAMRTAMIWISAAYRDAAERLKQGDRDVEFPLGTFPPRLPFVREVEILEPG